MAELTELAERLESRAAIVAGVNRYYVTGQGCRELSADLIAAAIALRTRAAPTSEETGGAGVLGLRDGPNE